MARAKKKIHYIYKTTCLVTDRYYIGMHSTNNIDDGYMGSGKRLRRSIRKYGKENHIREILGYYDSRELLIEAEIEAITEEMIGDKDCMNLMRGGYGGLSSQEHRKAFLKAGIDNFNKSKEKREKSLAKTRLTPEYRENMSKSKKKYFEVNDGTFKGKTHSNETKEKMSETMKGKGTGKTNSQYGTCWITNGTENKKINKEELETYISQGWEKGRKLK